MTSPLTSFQGKASDRQSLVIKSWGVAVGIDPALGQQESPPAPEQPLVIIALNKTTHLIGRTSAARIIHPEISLDVDDAVSHRHALLQIQDGHLILRDLGSANGTRLNGTPLVAMQDVVVQNGDIITLGHWTKLQIVGSAS